MKFIGQKYSQFNQEFISLTMPFEQIDLNSEVLIYGEDKYGYQRSLDKKHYSKIKEALLEKSSHKIFPTSIILSVTEKDLNGKVNNYQGIKGLVEIELGSEKIFRVVDGQHRLAGLREAAKIDKEFNQFMLNVVIMIISKENRVLEVQVFTDINKEAKKLKTDLTLLAMHNYRVLEEKQIQDLKELVDHLSVKVAYNLNSKSGVNGVWNKAINFEVNSKSSLGIVGISAFTNSINRIVQEYIIVKGIQNRLQKDSEKDLMEIKKEFIDYLDNCAEELAAFLFGAWEAVIYKWEDCFKLKKIIIDNEIQSINYDSKYYIQKTTGINAIHSILFDSIKEFKFEKEALEDFEKKITESKIGSVDWKIGGMLSGLTSQSGFSKAKGYILEKK